MKIFDLKSLLEGRIAPLYHGTNIRATLEILKTDQMKGVIADYVSFTRDFKRAQKFAMTGYPNTAIVLEFDQNRLSHNTSLKPYNYYSDMSNGKEVAEYGLKTRWPGDHHRNEMEERAAAPVKNVSRSLTAIHVIGVGTMASIEEYFPVLRDHPLLKKPLK